MATFMTAAEATVSAMLAHGIDTIYALPGVQNDELFAALFKAQDWMRTVHTRHEQGAAYMALGAALATAKPSAYAVVPGPGLLNSAAARHPNGLGKALLERVQLVVDRNSQRLEDPLRRVAVAEARRRRDRCLDRLHQLAGALDRLLEAAAGDRPRDLPGEPLLAVPPEDQLELSLRRRRQSTSKSFSRMA